MKLSNSCDTTLSNPEEYQRLIGRLICLTKTRLDLTFAVQHLSQFMHKPKSSHLEAVIRVVRYLKGSPGKGLLFTSKKSSILRVYCDLDWASLHTKRSVTGFCIKLGDSLISWKSKRQDMVARSSAEAEYRSMASAMAEMVRLEILFKKLLI